MKKTIALTLIFQLSFISIVLAQKQKEIEEGCPAFQF